MSSVRIITPDDVAAAMRLKEAAGWNQTGEDWRNVMRVEPEGCFGIDCDGTLAATATAVCYGRELAWIGMVLTAPEFRGRGLARRLMCHALDFTASRGVKWVKLDATDMGKPLYCSLGFEDECAIVRWGRQPAPCEGSELPALEEIPAALDREAFGADRVALLRLLAPIESARGPEGGYAMGRPGSKAAYFGPCVSRSAEEARALLAWFVARHADEQIYWDLLESNPVSTELAREFGFQPLRKLWRQARRGAATDATLERNDLLVFGTAGFEFG